MKTLLSALVAIALPTAVFADEGDPPKSAEADEAPKNANHEGPHDDGVNRPSSGFTVGLGFGWNFPADLQIPDTTSARLRFASGLIIEPAVELSRLSESDEVGPADTTDNTTVLAVGAAARFPVLSSNRMDLVGVAGGALLLSVIDPDGGNNDTSITGFTAFYGIGIDFWIRQHWALSFTTTNPLFTLNRTNTDGGGAGDTTSTDTFFGVVFDPDVLVMVHLFFD